MLLPLSSKTKSASPLMIYVAIAFHVPQAFTVIIMPLISVSLSYSGMAVITLDFSA